MSIAHSNAEQPLSKLESKTLRLEINFRSDLVDRENFQDFCCYFDYFISRDNGKGSQCVQITAEELLGAHFTLSEILSAQEWDEQMRLLQERVGAMFVDTHSDVLWSLSVEQRAPLLNEISCALYREGLLMQILNYFPTGRFPFGRALSAFSQYRMSAHHTLALYAHSELSKKLALCSLESSAEAVDALAPGEETSYTKKHKNKACYDGETTSKARVEFNAVVRLGESVSVNHGVHNSIVALIAPVEYMQSLSSNYSCRRDEHKDRVDVLFAMSLADILSCKGRKATERYFEEIVKAHFFPAEKEDNNGEVSAESSVVDEKMRPKEKSKGNKKKNKANKSGSQSPPIKLKVKHHLDVLFSGIQRTWRFGSAASPDEQMHCPYHLAHSSDGDKLAVLLSIKKAGSKFEIDIPGGRREMGETSWECAVRETWEEIGIDLQSTVTQLSHLNKEPAIKGSMDAIDWVLVQHRQAENFSCYIVLQKDLCTAKVKETIP